ncbi:hypothetical protein [Paenibacillus campi]|uniref:hypothetical protein n=1 Tax=Paenibacillus campi TaxID=3106031 RepID=UPI002AFF0301|nr:hypothetical protein [Paenibacillus sp. SGZ-1009]
MLKRKLGLIVLSLLIVIVLISQSAAQRYTAETIAFLYVNMTHSDRKIVGIEYVSAFDHDVVSLKSKTAETSSLSFSPTFFPVILDYDSEHPPA